MTTPPDAEQGQDLVRSEEEAEFGVRVAESGAVQVRKVVERERHTETVPLAAEHAETERAPAGEDDTGEVLTLDDGSISIPVFEEQLVVEKRRVLKERVIVRKRTVVEEHEVQAELAKERVEISASPEVADRVHHDEDPPAPDAGSPPPAG